MRNMQWQGVATPVPMKVIRGELMPANEDDMNDSWNKISLNQAFDKHGLRYLTLFSCTWTEEGIKFKVLQPVDGPEDNPIKFLNALNEVMKTEAAKRLNLSGQFQLIFDTGTMSPEIVNVTINQGEISYQQAHLTWPQTVTMEEKQ